MQRVTKYRKLLHIPIQSTSSAFYHTHLELRKSFEDYFKSKGHTHLPSASVLSDNDPARPFVESVFPMFKNKILDPNFTEKQRFSSIQKCIRADRDDLAINHNYHYFFEMMGVQSFNDAYSKKEAIEYAWDYLVNVLKIDSDRLYVTYFKGNVGGVEVEDHETKEIWEGILGKNSNKIIPFDKENFWEMGATGPCGPCTEIHYDRVGNRNAADLVNNHYKVVEIWNIVFMSKLRQQNGKISNLGRKHIDTSVGFERLLSVVQERSRINTDLFEPIMHKILEKSRFGYNGTMHPNYRPIFGDPTGLGSIEHEKIANLIRGVSFAISDGVVPDSTGPGFFVRKMMHEMFIATDFPHLQREFLWTLPRIVAKTMGKEYPNLNKNVRKVEKILTNEEERFWDYFERDPTQYYGMRNKSHISGKEAYDLLSIHSVPFDIMMHISWMNGVEVDVKGYEECVTAAKEQSKKKFKRKKAVTQTTTHSHDSMVYEKTRKDNGEYKFPIQTAIVRSIKNFENVDVGCLKPGQSGMICMDKNNFFFESGGQMSDTGVLLKGDDVVFEVDDVILVNGSVYLKGMAKEVFEIYDVLGMCVDAKRRMGLMRAHSGTHVLNWAIQKAGLGNGQKGSKVEADRIRFDYALNEIRSEDDYNTKIAAIEWNLKEALDGKNHMTTRTDIEESGGVKKRIVTLGRFGITEACCGTHVDNIADITDIVIMCDHEHGINARRVYAVTGPIAQQIRKYANDLRQRILEADKQTIVDIQKKVDWDQVPLTEYAELSKLLREKDEELKKVAEIKNLMTKRKKEPKKKAKNC